jgi:hypothetical protein
MAKTLAMLAAAAAFLLSVQAVRDHAAVIREGYGISRLEKEREELVKERARARERLSRLRSPRGLAERAKEFGLVADYAEEYAVVLVAPPVFGSEGTLLAQGN